MSFLTLGPFTPGTQLCRSTASPSAQGESLYNATYRELNMELMMKLLDEYLDKHARVRINGNVAADESATRHGEALRANFRRLYRLQYKLTDPKNIGERHIKALCQDFYDQKLAPKTISGYLSHLRIFCSRIGKKGLVKDVYYYLPNVPKDELHVKTVATKSKSWAEVGIDVAEKVCEAEALDLRFAVMLMLQVAFGLRRKEVLQLKPWVVDREDRIAITETKGGRPRSIYIDTPVQRWVLDKAKALTKGKNDPFGWKERQDGKPMKGKDLRKASFEYSTSRYNYLMQKLGISKQVSACTGHGLRAQFSENSALLSGLIPTTLGGTPGQMPRDEMEVIRLQNSESLGHSRLSVTPAYYGSFGRECALDGPDRAKDYIEACLKNVTHGELKAIAPERLQQCMALCTEIAAIGVYDDPRKIQFLWEHYSRRYGIDWLPPANGENLAAIEASALSIMRAATCSSDET